MTTIRDWRPEDVPTIKSLLAQLQAVEAAHQPVRKTTPAAMAEDVWTETARLLGEGKADVLVAEASGAVVAVGIGFEMTSSDLSLTVAARRVGYISDLVVDAAWRGKGLGSILVNGLLDRFRGRGLKTGKIGAISENVGAIALYEDLGFRPVSVTLETAL